MLAREPIEYNGDIYRCHKNKGYYFSCKGKTTLSLHREIYKKEVGMIPNGMQVHHKDFNQHNNEVSNLQLLSAFDHRSIHMAKRWETIEWVNKVKDANPHEMCVHRGKEAARKRIQYMKVNPIIHTCEVCGKETLLLTPNIKKYCSFNCKTKAWRNRHKGGAN